MIADTVRVEQRGLAFGFHRAMDHAGAVIGPIIGYVLVILFVANAKSPTTREFSKDIPGGIGTGIDRSARRDLFNARVASA
jgi:lipoprotein signal peptidase